MKRYLYLTALFLITACDLKDKPKDKVWNELPDVTSLDNLKQTDFALTLENPVSENKNIIYSPAFLYAWDKIKEELRLPILVKSINSADFSLLNNSISHHNTLTDNEYSATTEIVDGAIIARAFFNKTLPFETKLQRLDEPIDFNGTKVSAFGMYNYDESALIFTHILYYKDDNNFILKLTPKDKTNEIILVKGLEKYRTLKDAIQITNDLIVKGQAELSNARMQWKYQITRDDIFAIPSIKFNIATHYKNLEGQTFWTSDNEKHTFEVAFQRTGFILNENGAVVESEAIAAADSMGPEEVVAHPKKMIFDKPFLIIIKHVDNANPYFVMKVANAELLTRKQ